MVVRGSISKTSVVALVAATLIAGCQGETPEALVASAKEYISKGDRNSAVIELKNALQKTPDLGEARYLLGRALLETGDVTAAEKEFRKALELKFPTDQVVPPLARTLTSLGEFKQVTDEFAKVEVTMPEGKAELQSAIGLAHMALGNPGAAREAFAAALAAQPEYLPARLGQARMAAGNRDLAGALATVDSALKTTPRHADGWHLKGDILLAQGQPDLAVAAYRKVVEVKPDHLSAHSAIVWLLARQEKFEVAAEQLEVMKRAVPHHPQTLYLQALLAYGKNNFVAAREAIQQQIKAAPNNLPGMLLAGAVEYRLESYIQAENHLLKVLQRVPNHGFARRILVTTYLQSGQPGKALEVLKPTLDGIGNDSDMLALAGEVYQRNRQPAEAANYFAKAVALDPANAGKRTSLALSHIAGGKGEGSIRELERAAAADSGVSADLALIVAHLQRREYDKALGAIDALHIKQPNSPLAHNVRGAALLAMGEAAEARKSFEHALALDPTFFAAVASLASLDIREEKPDDASHRFQAVLAKDPKNLQAMLALAELRAKAGGTSEEVAALIRNAVAANPAAPAPRLALIGHYMSAKDASNMVVAAQEALVAIPDRPEILDAAGRAQLTAGQTNQALATYQRLASVQPNSPLPYLRMADVQLKVKDKVAAMLNLRKVLELGPDFIESSMNVAGRPHTAVGVAGNAERAGPPENARLLNNLAWAAGQLKDPRAVEYAEKANKLAPNQPAIMDTLGVLLMEKGDITRGLEFLQKATELDPRAPEIRLNLAKSLIKAGQKKMAKKELDELARLGDESPEQAEVVRLSQGL